MPITPEKIVENQSFIGRAFERQQLQQVDRLMDSPMIKYRAPDAQRQLL